MMAVQAPVVKDLVLLGGGHTHVEVLRSFGMRPMPGVRLTLITRDMHTPYSGMLPGYISGFYTYDECHIDLARLAMFAKARIIHQEAEGIDIKTRRVLLGGRRPPIAYDALSINVGITPADSAVPGAREHAVPVKPIDRFVVRFEALLERYAEAAAASAQPMASATAVGAASSSAPAPAVASPLRLVIVGGGAGGVEVALALSYRLERERAKLGLPLIAAAHLTLVTRGTLLQGSTGYVQRTLRRALAAKGVALAEGDGVSSVSSTAVMLSSGVVLPCDACIWCTQAKAAGWLTQLGLPTEEGTGFLSIRDTLQSDGGPPEVFACGDVASCATHPRPKAGVFAVRQGPPLTANLRAFLGGQPLVPFVPQSTWLSLISTGDKNCVGTKGWLAAEGGWLWTWKDGIDRAFMHKYSDGLKEMRDKMMAAGGSGGGLLWPWAGGSGSSSGAAGAVSLAAPPAFAAAGPEALALFAEASMRCGGCGAKVGASTLSRVLARLQARRPALESAAAEEASGVVAGLGSPDDAALLRPPPPGRLLVHTVDFFRSFWPDPYLFGAIAANHALGDVYAMGGEPRSALALAVVPLMGESQVEEELAQMMAGALSVLDDAGCALVGGHTGEGQEAALGFSVHGDVAEGDVMHKGGLAAGQVLLLTQPIGTGAIMAGAMLHICFRQKKMVLLLTKPIGTGAIMAGAMKGAACVRGRDVSTALAAMAHSSAAAAKVLRAHGCTAATDVTGFGLLGHLVEMARGSGSGVRCEIELSAVPLLPGAATAVAAGVTSSLHRSNARAMSHVANASELMAGDARWPLLVDPQTGGGLLAAVPADRAVSALAALRASGYAEAAAIGRVVEGVEAVAEACGGGGGAAEGGATSPHAMPPNSPAAT
ncbi:hypothetical protein FOA52_010693 [Chlamydomonas sp. UWO 241]|nr:hypothetical protein FOA52_010693 [Chlamydomonas sp. UWO 241]